jgi:hypothetical protein
VKLYTILEFDARVHKKSSNKEKEAEKPSLLGFSTPLSLHPKSSKAGTPKKTTFYKKSSLALITL